MKSGESRKSVLPEGSRYGGFSLQSVCWGYRDIFAKAIEGLFRQKLLGPEREEITRQFFELLKNCDQAGFDHVLKEFLQALSPRTRWLLELPGIFVDVTAMGQLFAESKIYYGTAYFRILGENGFGDSPQDVQNLMRHLRRLRETDEELAFAFLQGYRHLLDNLDAAGIELFIAQGLQIFHRNRKSALGFMRGDLQSSGNVIRMLTRDARLTELQPLLTSLLKALVGYEVEVSHLGRLDSDFLLERGTPMVCMYKWLYLPFKVRYFDSPAQNRNWYMLMALVAAGMPHRRQLLPHSRASALPDLRRFDR